MEEEGVWYYSFVPRSLGSRWVGLGELMFRCGLAISWSRKGEENCHACYPALDEVVKFFGSGPFLGREPRRLELFAWLLMLCRCPRDSYCYEGQSIFQAPPAYVQSRRAPYLRHVHYLCTQS